MSERVAEVLELASRLPREERDELIGKLIERAERDFDENEPLDDEVGREAVRRLREVERGDAETIPAEEVFAELEARFRATGA